MKNSGIEWIGKIPKSWRLQKGRYLFKQRNEKGNKNCLQLLSPSQQYGVIPQNLLEELTTQKAVKLKDGTDLNLLKTVHKGDFCISLRSFQGGFEYSTYEGVVSPAYQIFYKNSNIVDNYYRFMFKDASFIKKMNSYTMSLRDGKNIAYFDFGNSYLPVPPYKEQQQIADFLDSKCSEIDDITADIQKEITVLEDYKKFVITEAVTKGLNPNVEMKDSGIEWIGKIPKHWKLTRLKYLLKERMKYGATESGVSYSNQLPRYIRITDISLDGKLKKENMLSLPEAIAKNYLLTDKTILFARSGATVGKTFLYHENNGRAAFAGYLISAYCDIAKCIPEFLYFYTKSAAYDSWVNLIFEQATIQNISADKYQDLIIPITNTMEQQKIINLLDSKCSEIDATIADKQKQLEILSDYKKSLIYEYVTGKKEVPCHE